MQIRDKLTLRFTAIVALILLLFCLAIYNLMVLHADSDFESRLKERALNTAQLLLEVDEIDENLLKTLRRKYLQSLPHEFVRIYNPENEIIYKDDTVNYEINIRDLKDIKETGLKTSRDGNRICVGIYYKANKQQYTVIASAIDIYGNKKIKNLFYVLTIGYFICLLILIISGRFFSIEALKPISRIIKQVERITGSNLYLRLEAGKNKDEIYQLAITFNKMFDRIENAFEMQKRFVSNASHELRTPLTSIRGEIEVALMKERDEKEYKETLASILEETKKLTRLSNGLLELAQTGGDAIIQKSRLNIDEIIARITEETLKRHAGKQLILELQDIEEETIYIQGNEELLLTAFKNVIGNAFKFSIGSPVILKTSKERDVIKFSVTDSGIGISPEDLNNVFQAFFRSENVSNIPGHGIGLSLTERIIKLHNGSIQIFSKEGKGTTVEMMLPIYEHRENFHLLKQV